MRSMSWLRLPQTPDAWLPCRVGIGFGGQDSQGTGATVQPDEMPRQCQSRPPTSAATHQQGCLWVGGSQADARRAVSTPPSLPFPFLSSSACRAAVVPRPRPRAEPGQTLSARTSTRRLLCTRLSSWDMSSAQNRSMQGCFYQAKSSGIERYRSELSTSKPG